MKTLRAVLGVAIFSFICVRTASAQQCSTPTWQENYKQTEPFPPPCPAGGPNASPYILVGVSLTGTAIWTCTSTANAVSPPGPNTVYFYYNEANYTGSQGPQTGSGQMYCNTNHAPYDSYFCGPNVSPGVTTATSASDYNRFFNRAYSYTAANGSCPQSGYAQDFQQCPGLACQQGPAQCPPTGSPPYCNNPQTAQWDYNSCSWFCGSGSPILIDVSGHGFELTSAAGGVSYDISGNGSPIQIGWTAPGAQNAFLCLPDANGCNSGKQLFGNFTPQPASSTPNGFAALAVYDANHDGVIDARDAIFSSLRLWIDANHDGISQPNELFTLPALGITSISLNYKWDQRTDQYGNVFRYRAQVGSTSGGRMAYDVFLVTQPNSTASTKSLSCPVPKTRILTSSKTGGFSR